MDARERRGRPRGDQVQGPLRKRPERREGSRDAVGGHRPADGHVAEDSPRRGHGQCEQGRTEPRPGVRNLRGHNARRGDSRRKGESQDKRAPTGAGEVRRDHGRRVRAQAEGEGVPMRRARAGGRQIGGHEPLRAKPDVLLAVAQQIHGRGRRGVRVRAAESAAEKEKDGGAEEEGEA